jgi:UDP-N-acetylmuramoyl-tripeptide--D-alanyl-D-alanine ligase
MKHSLFEQIQTDLSKVQAGDWFLPMTIKEINQHAFIAEALTKGAVGFTYEEGQNLPASVLETTHFAVPNLREHLFAGAQEKRIQLNAQIAVVAGSAGKTSVKELIGAILKSWHQDSCFISPDNQNTKIALATQILRLPPSCQSAAFEMGARRSNDFVIPLSYLQPSVVALLNIGTAHIGEFGSKENLWKEKLSCLDSEFAKTLVVPADDSAILKYANLTGKNILSFGFSQNSHIQVLEEELGHVTLSINHEVLKLICPFQSSAKALNVAAAVAVATAMGAPLSAIEEGLAHFRGVPRRFQLFNWGPTSAIDDAFNASPESLKEGLHQLKKISSDRKILLVIGSMLELGESTETEHRQVAHLIKNLFGIENSHLTLATVGVEAEVIGLELVRIGFAKGSTRHFTSSHDATVLKEERSDFDLVYFKGSKSIQLNKIFGEL